MSIFYVFFSKAYGQSTPKITDTINEKSTYHDSLVNDIDFLEKVNGVEEITSLPYHRGTCKEITVLYLVKIKTKEIPIEKNVESVKCTERIISKSPFLRISGNVLYNFNYRSFIDTPYAESNIMQHVIQTNMNVIVKDKYPFHISFTQRLSNSPFFANAAEINFVFRKAVMLENIKSQLRNDLDQEIDQSMLTDPEQIYRQHILNYKNANGTGNKKMISSFLNKNIENEIKKKFDSLYKKYETINNKIDSINRLINNPNPAQLIIEEREKRLHDSLTLVGAKGDSRLETHEKKLRNSLEAAGRNRLRTKILNDSTITDKNSDSLNQTSIDSVKEKITDSINKTAIKIADKKKQLDSLKNELAENEKNIKSYQKKITDSLVTLKAKISKIGSSQDLTNYLHEKVSPASQMTKAQKFLLSINQVGIGKTWLDYSELTVKNISLSGVNVEINPGKLYLAAATGTINYRFRDFVLKGKENSLRQNISILRVGAGSKERNNIIFSYYTGRKNILNTPITGSNSPTMTVMGLAVETRMKIDENTNLSAEIARSSTLINQAPNNFKRVNKIFDFTSNNNQAWNVKVNSSIPLTGTKVNAYYRRIGESFESFSLYPSYSKQDAWLIHISQPFIGKRILADVSVKKNDFNSPVAAPDFSTSTIFKSAQLTIRIPKYPLATIGYYPTSQLLKGNDNLLYESQFNTLNFIVSHTYKAAGLNMNTNATMTKFYNSSSDTTFIYYNASSIILNHSIYLSKFILQGIFSMTSQRNLKLLTIEPLVSYQFKNILTLTGSAKCSRLNSSETLWGGTAGLGVQIRQVGGLQIQYDKIHLPGYHNNNLMPADIGRLTFNRQF